MAAMNIVSTRGFSGVSFHLRRCPQGVASVLCKKTLIFRSRRSKLDHLTVHEESVEKLKGVFRITMAKWLRSYVTSMLQDFDLEEGEELAIRCLKKSTIS